jgi:hypothetical protein
MSNVASPGRRSWFTAVGEPVELELKGKRNIERAYRVTLRSLP